jgi:predicted phage-related endonuclease
LADSRDREAWLAARAELVTASDVSRMLCCGWAKNEAERAQQRAVLRTLKAFGGEAMEETEGMVIARYLEPAVIEYQRVENGWTSLVHNTVLYGCDEEPRLGATPDGVYVDSDGVECDVDVKVMAAACADDCVEFGMKTATFCSGMPVYYAAQLNAQMAVSGRQRSYLLVLHHADRFGMKVRAYRQDRHELIVRRILSEVPLFWAEVMKIRTGENV